MPPAAHVPKVSIMQMSKCRGLNWSVRSSAVKGKAAVCQASRLARAPCRITMPLGRPVEPEV